MNPAFGMQTRTRVPTAPNRSPVPINTTRAPVAADAAMTPPSFAVPSSLDMTIHKTRSNDASVLCGTVKLGYDYASHRCSPCGRLLPDHMPAVQWSRRLRGAQDRVLTPGTWCSFPLKVFLPCVCLLCL